MAAASLPGGTSRWAVYAVPAACLASSYLIYANRRKLFCWAYELIAKAGISNLMGKAYLAGNYGPIDDEIFHENLQLVEGALPDGFEGCYVRTGPNPFLKPVAGYHWFDGDGMLHAVRVRDGRATYCNRYVNTERLQQEKATGHQLFLRLGDFRGLNGVGIVYLEKLAEYLGIVRKAKGAGTANTALVYHAGRLLALHEGDLPYGVRILCNGLIETMGRMVFEKNWKGPFTAHPKLDPVTGELLTFGYSFARNPYVTAGVMDKHGRLTRHWGVDLPYPVMMHDMVATEHYIVLLHMPLCFDPAGMVKNDTVPFIHKKDLPGRVGLLRRDQPSCPEGGAQVTWFELPGPGAVVMHSINAWEDSNGDVKVYVCQMDDINLNLDLIKTEELAFPTEYTLSPSTGAVGVRRLTNVSGDFPVVNPSKATRPCRWAWIATFDACSHTPSITGCAKIDLAAAPNSDACVGRIAYPAGTYGGEALFVPRDGSTDEDDGYLVVYVHDTHHDVSYMNLYDARTMVPKPVASLRMPRRVPHGFHGAWVSEQQLKRQVMWV